MTEFSRRSFFATVGTMAGGAWLSARMPEIVSAAHHASRVMSGAEPRTFTVLKPAEAATIEAISAHIIPTDDTPGAREAGAVYFIDRMLAVWKPALQTVRKGLKDLRARVAKAHPGKKTFESLTIEQQHAILEDLTKTDDAFFETIRGMTIGGMFANPEYGGNRDKIGWKLLGFDDRFLWSEPFGYYDRQG